jgi:hypothetical protein
MKSFNCERAWAELACIDYDCLPRNIRHLVSMTIQASQDLVQGESLDMPWPSEENLCALLEAGKIDREVFDACLRLRGMFEKTPAEDLAWAARVVYSYGHWAPLRVVQQDLFKHRLLEHMEQAHRFQKTGGYWKFANYADQELTRRIGIERNRKHSPRGISAVHQGCLRVYWSHPNLWCWTEVGWATKVAFERLSLIAPPTLTVIGGRTTSESYDQWDAYVARLKASSRGVLCEEIGRFERWTNLESYMEEA